MVALLGGYVLINHWIWGSRIHKPWKKTCAKVLRSMVFLERTRV